MDYYGDYDYGQIEGIKTYRQRIGEDQVEYLNIEAAFDIETTSYDDPKCAFMYVWMMGIGHGKQVVYGRKWVEFKDFIGELSDYLDLGWDRRLVVYVHNLAYEFQFMRKYFEWKEVFAVGERKPIKALTFDGVEFRDSYILSGQSLANTARNLTKYPVMKLEGDLDYSLTRHHETPLTEQERGYCENDIRVVTAYIREEIERYGNVTKIPATNTGRVRKFVRDRCYNQNSKAAYKKYRQKMNDLTLTEPVYRKLKQAFMGGFTHASNRHSHQTLHGVDSIDLTSSYPTVMLSEQFPMSRPRPIEIRSLEEFDQLKEQWCLLLDVQFDNLTNKIGYESYISKDKCQSIKGEVIDNGRVYEAEQLTMTLTDVDLDIIRQVYSCESMAFGQVLAFRKAYLPKEIMDAILTLYEKKTQLKGVKGSEADYLLSKGMLNSVYGMSVTDPLQDEHKYTNEIGWFEEAKSVMEALDSYNENGKRFLYYPWGVWVTAYARRNVWTAILNVGEDYVYCDTDSVKMLNYEKHKPFVEKHNEIILSRLEQGVSENNLDPSRIRPNNKDGVEKPLGVWEHEGHYEAFKTLGAKRYLYKEDGEFELVVAGLSKQKAIQYMTQFDPFEIFTDELHVPGEHTGKLTHTYIDEKVYAAVQDYNGVYAEVSPESGIHLEPADFTLSVSDQYIDFLKRMNEGYVYTGVALV